MATKRKRRTVQNPKPRNEAMAEGMRELRKGNRAQPHALKNREPRRPKHRNRVEW